MLRERKSAIANVFGNDTDGPGGGRSSGRSRKAASTDRYSANPKFAGQVEVEPEEAAALATYDEERAYVEQLRRRLSRLSTQEAETEITARRKRLPSLALAQTVSRPLGQALDDYSVTAPLESPRCTDAGGGRPTRVAEEVCAAARAFLRSPAGEQFRERAVILSGQSKTSSDTGLEFTAAVVVLRELRELALAVLKESVVRAPEKSGDQSDDSRGLVSKMTARKRKRPANSSNTLGNSACTVALDETEEMQVVDAILAELLPADTFASLFECLKRAPTTSDEVWLRATKRYVETVTVPEGVDLSLVAQQLEKMVLHLHAPGEMLGLLLRSVKALYAAAGKDVSADELLPLFIASVARCASGSNMAALQRFVEELGHFSPCGEVARYLTDLCAAVAHIVSEDGRALVREWLLAHEVEPDEVEFFLAEGYSGDACVHELELLSEEQLEALVDELTGALE